MSAVQSTRDSLSTRRAPTRPTNPGPADPSSTSPPFRSAGAVAPPPEKPRNRSVPPPRAPVRWTLSLHLTPSPPGRDSPPPPRPGASRVSEGGTGGSHFPPREFRPGGRLPSTSPPTSTGAGTQPSAVEASNVDASTAPPSGSRTPPHLTNFAPWPGYSAGSQAPPPAGEIRLHRQALRPGSRSPFSASELHRRRCERREPPAPASKIPAPQSESVSQSREPTPASEISAPQRELRLRPARSPPAT